MLNRLPRIRHRRRQTAIHRNCLSIHIRRFIARQKQPHRRELVRLAGARQRIELADLVLVPRSWARSNIGWVMPVSIRPGHTAFTRTPVP